MSNENVCERQLDVSFNSFTRRTADIKENPELLGETRNQIRRTTVLQVWVFTGSAYFIVEAEMCEKRGLFCSLGREVCPF